MKSSLLAVIRSEIARRHAPAVVAMAALDQRAAPSAAKRFVIRLRREVGVIRRCVQINRRLSALPGANVLLPGMEHKYDELRDELIQAGAAPSSLATISGKGKLRPRDTLGLFVYLACVRLVLAKKTRAADYWEVIGYYLTIKRCLRRAQTRHVWPVIGDLSPWLIAFARAAEDAGHQVVAWQYGYLDFKRFPVRSTYACVLNSRGLALARRDPEGEMAVTGSFWRPTIKLKLVELEQLGQRPVGVMLKAQSGTEAVRRCVKLASVVDQQFEVRLHPNSKLSPSDFPAAVKVADPKESMTDFLDRMGLIICGNTTAQLEAVANGKPVVQCAGLDPLPFDTYRYYEMRIVPGIRSPDALDLDQITSFYADPGHADRVRALLGPPSASRQPFLSNLTEALAQ